MRSPRSDLAGQVLITVVLSALVVLAGRLVYINTHHGSQLLARAARQQRSVIPLKHRRGLIVDCRGRIISGTLLRKSVFADPKLLPDKEAAARTAAEILESEPGELRADILAAGDRRFFVIRRGVSAEQAEKVKQVGVYGLGVFDEPYRTYPMSGLAAALTGFVSPDGRGISGLEYQCDAWLRGENGVKTIIRDARRKAFWLADGGYRPARDGFHLVLTIDAEIQATAERELAAQVAQYRAESGIAIVMHPRTGEILAMANEPGFDPNRYGDFRPGRYRNRIITDPYEPGSTFKPFVAAAALAEGVVKLGEVFDCERGTWQDGRRVLHDHHPFDRLTFEEIVIKSSNIGMAKVGKRLGNEALWRYVRAFGFGEKTGVDLLGEAPGILRPLSRWDAFTTTSVPMGYEVAVTPLQLARAFCALVNGGVLVRPTVIRAVLAADGRVVRDFSDPVVGDVTGEGCPPAKAGGSLAGGSLSGRRAVPEDIAESIKQRILLAVVNEGTGSRARLASHQVLGKTGTAKIVREDGRGYEQGAYVASFVGVAPARDPQLVVLVAIRRPDPALGYYGGTVAAPVVREILARALVYLQIEPDRPGVRDGLVDDSAARTRGLAAAPSSAETD